MVACGWFLSFLCIAISGYLGYRVLKYQWLKSLGVNVFVFAALWIGGCALYCALPRYAPSSDGGYVVIERNNGSSQMSAVTTTAVVSRVKCSTEDVHGISLLSAANRVTAAFFPSRGGFETTESDDIRVGSFWGQFLYYLFHWLVMFYVALLVFSLFGRHLVDKFFRWKMRWTKGDRWKMCVFWCDPESARILAENLRSEEGVKGLGFVPKILFLLPGWLKYEGSARASILRLSDKGYVLDFIDGLSSDADKYNVVGKNFELGSEDVAGRRHFLLSENSAYNIGLARAIVEKRCGENGAYAKEKLDLYIRVENSASSSTLKDWADAKMSAVPGEVNIHIFRETEVMAEGFIRNYPILRHRSSDGKDSCGWLLEGDGDLGVAKTRSDKDGLDVLIVGFGNRGQELLDKMLENSQFLNVDDAVIPTRFFIVDKCDADGCCPAREIYRRRSPEIVEPPETSQFKVEFLDQPGDVAKDGFASFGIKVSDYDRIVVCTGDDELNVQIANIARCELVLQGVKLEPGRLFVQLQSNDVAEREMDKYRLERQGEKGLKWEMLKDCPVQYFGMWKDIFTYDGILDEDMYYGARLLNWRYCCTDETKLPGDCPLYKTNANGEKELACDTVVNEWRKTKWFDKESSIASYRGMLNILALMGYELVQGDSPKKDEETTFGEKFVNSESAVWKRLAQVEHLRWMIFMRTHGVRRWDLINPSIEEVDRVGKIAGKAKVKPNVRELINRHGALADYDKLPMVSMRLANYNDKCDFREDNFRGEGLVGRKGYQDNLQWNDMKFVKWIPVLFSKLWEEGDLKMKIAKDRS